MKIVIAGPFDAGMFRALTGLKLDGAPKGYTGSPPTQLAAVLLARGHEVSVVALATEVSEPLTIREGAFSVTYCPLRAAPKYRARTRMMDLFAAEIAHLSEAMAAYQPDIIHAHWTYEFAEAAVRTGLPHLVTMHDLGWDYLWQLRDAYRAMRLVMKYRVMRRVKALTVVAPFMERKAATYGYRGPVWVVPNGLAVPPIDWNAAKRKAGQPLKLVTIGNPGRIKNVRASIAALKLVRQRVPDAELHLFGPGLGPDFDRSEGVVAHGEVRSGELMDFLRDEATILIHPSRLETFGLIIAEAKLFGVPVVGGESAGGVPFACDGAEAGCRLVDIHKPEAIADAVAALCATPEAYLANARLAREDAASRFDIETVATLYTNVYRAVLAA